MTHMWMPIVRYEGYLQERGVFLIISLTVHSHALIGSAACCTNPVPIHVRLSVWDQIISSTSEAITLKLCMMLLLYMPPDKFVSQRRTPQFWGSFVCFFMVIFSW